MTRVGSQDTSSGFSNFILLLGLTTSLLAITMEASVPVVVRDGSLLLLAVGLIWRVVTTGGTNHTLVFWPILLVLLGVLPSLFNSINIQASQETLSFLPIGFVLFLSICMTGDVGRRVIAISSLVAVLLMSIDGTLRYLIFSGLFPGREIADTLPHPNDIALIAILLPIGVMGLNRIPRGIALGIGTMLIPLVVFAVVTSCCRNAWIGLAIAGLSLAIWKRGLIRISVGSGLILAMLLVAIDVANVQNRFLSLADPMQDSRIGLWISAMTMFLQHPFTGTGAGTFGFAYPDVVSMVQMPDGYQPESGFVPWAHNMYLELLAEYGLPGFLAFAIVTTWLVGKLAIEVVFDRAIMEKDEPGDLRNWAMVLLITWLILLVMGLFDLTFHKHWMVYLYWMLIGLGFSVVTQADSRSSHRMD